MSLFARILPPARDRLLACVTMAMIAGAWPTEVSVVEWSEIVGDFAASGAVVLEDDVRAEPAREQAATLYAALTQCGSELAEDERWVIADVIVDESWRHGYDPLFVQAIVEVESTCSPSARSRAGALGLIQVKPATARDVADRSGILWEGSEGLMRPEVNVEIGLRYLAELEERFSDPYLAVAAYNLGPTRVARMEPSSARRSRYVRKVMRRYEGLLREHPATSRS